MLSRITPFPVEPGRIPSAVVSQRGIAEYKRYLGPWPVDFAIAARLWGGSEQLPVLLQPNYKTVPVNQWLFCQRQWWRTLRERNCHPGGFKSRIYGLAGSFDYLTSFSATLNQPVNTVVFEVNNGYGPTGLIVEGTATINTSVPDGGCTAALLGGAIVGLQAVRRKLRG